MKIELNSSPSNTSRIFISSMTCGTAKSISLTSLVIESITFISSVRTRIILCSLFTVT
ncbi:hypothetical protein H206_05580 [Candidatus Electrothrix aarhusensis]|uniref:Uncharacterized protein n=1 Tax=Candidatus Electrothrix aarhusensis TaxID=1859131 RepID=A0A444J434_9BACT|nr:hypothetical protein H206_05580 [Candidatus Electrothrix aarhusensis]